MFQTNKPLIGFILSCIVPERCLLIEECILLDGVVVELALGDTVLVDGIKSPSKGQTVAHLSGDSVLLTDAVNQLLSGESDLHNLIVLLEVQLLDGVLDGHGGGESPRDSAVLGLADVLTESVLLQTALTEHIVARIHGSRVGKSMAISLFLALPEIRAVDAMPCL